MSMRWSRREFVQWMGYSSLASAGMASSLLPVANNRSHAKFAYVAVKDGREQGIHTYAAGARGWKKLERIESAKPVSLALSADRRFLYAVNEVDSHQGLPTGTVEAYAVGSDGRLRLLNRRGLALSATNPRHAAITPDGRHVVVAVRGGGAYNVLPIGEDGSLGGVSGILKETGVERGGAGRNAEPHMIAFDKAGRVVSVDGGADRLNVFSLQEGQIESQERLALDPGCQPTEIAMHPEGDAVYVLRAGGISSHRYETSTGRFSGVQQLSSHEVLEGSGTMAMHASGRFLYASKRGGGVSGWALSNGGSSVAKGLGVQVAEMGELHALALSPDGRSLVGLNRSKGLVQEAEIYAATGKLRSGRVLAQVDSPSSLALLYS